MGRPTKALTMSPEDRVQLESLARSQSLTAGIAKRAPMVVCMADGESNTAVAHRYRVSRSKVTLSCTRYRERGISGLRNELKTGRPRSTSEGAGGAVDRHGAAPQTEGQGPLVGTWLGS